MCIWPLLSITACDCRFLYHGKPQIYQNFLKSPEEAVNKFCDFDANGKRLSGTTWVEIRPYITWPDEPGWDTAILITSYAITDVKKSGDSAEVAVEYQVIGKYTREFKPLEKTEKISFKVVKTDTGWKIESPDFMPPHVFSEIIVKDLEENIKEESDTAKKEKMLNDLSLIKKASNIK